MTAPLSVLMLEDEYDAVSPLINVLRQAGHTVSYAKDLSAALVALDRTPFNWVFIDVMLDCTVPIDLKDAYALLNTGLHNQGQALGMYLWMRRNQARPDGMAWPGYAYLSNFSREHLADAKNPVEQEFGGSLDRFFLSKYQVAGGDICKTLASCMTAWKAL